MVPYRINPYLTFIENRLYPGVIQHGVFHRFTGEVLEPGERLRTLLLAIQTGNRISFSEEQLNSSGEDGRQLRQLTEKGFLIPDGWNPLTALLDQYAVRPIQNPALTYRSEDGDLFLVRTSMAQRVYSPKRGELPTIIEEKMPPVAGALLLLVDGTRTLRQIAKSLGAANGANILADSDLIEALDFLTSPERQLIKFTATTDLLSDPYKPFNTVPRNFYHSSRWEPRSLSDQSKSVIDFHRHGIEDASWEFDLIEPTINHSFRFPSGALGGLDYGARFCLSALKLEVVPLLDGSDRLEVLEVGGGTGTFARSFLQQASNLETSVLSGIKLNYQILELSPALIKNQRELLSPVLPGIQHFRQDATAFHIPGRKFDLIIANEVVADFPMAIARRNLDEPGGGDKELASDKTQKWQGDGVFYLEKYGLFDEAAPQAFLVNAGVFEFIERAWEHLHPGGTLIISEYGSESRYPVQSYHLNHEEFSIHFGHVKTCAEKIGFKCALLELKNFLGVDDEVLMLGGQEEHILCLNHVLAKHGMSLPYAALSKEEFERQFPEVESKLELTGLSFLPLSKGFHFGPNMEGFKVLIMNKPRQVK